MALQYVTDEELALMHASDKPVVALFSLERYADLTMVRVIGRIAEGRSDMQFCAVRLADDLPRAERHHVSAAPVIRVFAGGRPIAQFVGPQPKDTISRELDAIASRPPRDMPTLEFAQLHVDVPRGEWMNAVVSGVVAGVAFGFAIRYLTGVMVFIVPAFAVGVFVINEKMQFSWAQKVFAIVLMLVVGFFGADILRAGFAPP